MTATIYEDVGLLTDDPDITADVADLFNYLTGYSHQQAYRRILVAPISLRSRILELIHQEAEAPDGRIVMKMNSLVDAEMIDALYEASRAGTEIELIVRGICCLRPGVPRHVRDDPRPIDRGPVPRAFADLPVRERDAGPADVHRVGGPDAP